MSVALPRQAKLLLDENLSPTVAARLRKEGFEVVSVRDRGLRGKSDQQVLERAFAIALVIEGDLLMDEQGEVIRSLLRIVQGEHDAGRGLVNRVLRGGRNQAWTFDGAG